MMGSNAFKNSKTVSADSSSCMLIFTKENSLSEDSFELLRKGPAINSNTAVVLKTALSTSAAFIAQYRSIFMHFLSLIEFTAVTLKCL